MVEKRVHIYVTGVVQGVSFRYYTLQEAVRSGVSGWVRNLPDGRVEAIAEGDEAGVDRLVEWCHQGPRAARVEHVEVLPETPTGEFQGFRIR
ncbi:MAG: acylphosphatase [Chloroflexi bacterium]|nr:acylphosphatase [Chloroflexota bacterium]